MSIILLVNDDGIYSPGILALKRELEDLGEVFVVAPYEERSGVGKALSCGRLVRLRKVGKSNGSRVYAVDGTPADAYFVAVHKILKRKPDLLVSGINLGPNIGIDDFFTSGTLGAAIEAAIHKVPAIAISYCIERFMEEDANFLKENEANLVKAAKIARKTAEYVLMNGMPNNVDIISINVPDKIDSLSFKATTMSYKGFIDLYQRRKGGYIISQWTMFSYLTDETGTDVNTIKNEGKVSVTPIKLRFHHNINGIKNLIDFLNRGLKDES
jgi:5'-nucleotidase